MFRFTAFIVIYWSILSTAYAQTSGLVNRQNYFLESSMYQGFSSAACSRLQSAQGTTGCSALKMVSGTLYRISTVDDINSFLKTAPPSADYVVVMPTSLLTIDNINLLEKTGKVSGIFTITDKRYPASYSPEASCPNCRYGLYSNQSSPYIWNPLGNSVSTGNYEFPIFGIYPSDATSLQTIDAINEALQFNINRGYTGYPLYAMEFDSRMFSAIDSTTCLRRGRCQPIGGYSVWSTFSSNIDASDKKPIVMVTSKLDSSAFLRDYAFGASGRSGVIAMLATVETLSRVQGGIANLPKTVVFAAFEAESWAFAGSQRMVQDMTTPLVCKDASGKSSAGCSINGAQCNSPCFSTTDFTKLNFNLIDSVIEFDSIGDITRPAADASLHYIHVDTINSQTNQLLNQFKTALIPAPPISGTTKQINISVNVAASLSATNHQLPPSSAMAFLAKRPDIPAVVVSDYLLEFSNQYYHSEFDDGLTWNNDHVAAICGMVGVMAKGIYLQAGGAISNVPTINPDCAVVGQLMDCYTRNVTCALFQKLKIKSQTSVFTGYSSVYNPSSVSSMAMLSNLLMINWTASAVVGNCSDPRCMTLPSDYRCAGNLCVLSMTRLHRAFGTGLDSNDQGVYSVVDPQKGTWTESSWDTTRMRVFKVASKTYQGMQLGVGLALTIVSGLLTWFIRSYYRVRTKKE
ncbi:hypothetical protein BDV3_005421 [Batrachochytrium dendrobatidis]|uniref:Nicastrin n=1 Tax=Batrachochytrium dendrobatidis (strain JEL423) TaxID=403673 RepID=A0A177WJX9_BATDL|nr:hypothetical protein BDEG_23473 [Batrachochytrium dendrobatidis JEL423]